MKVTISSQSEQTLLTLDAVKAYLRVTDSAQDPVIMTLIDAAIDKAESFLWRSLRAKSIVCEFYDSDQVYLPHAPVDTITKVEYYDGEQWVETTEADGFTHPVDYDDVINLEYKNMRVTYTTKAYDSSEVKGELLDIILDKYEKRGEYSDLVKSLINHKRTIAS